MQSQLATHQVEKYTVPLSPTSAWARAKDRGAGPRTTLPSALYWEPWQGHLNLFSACVSGGRANAAQSARKLTTRHTCRRKAVHIPAMRPIQAYKCTHTP